MRIRRVFENSEYYIKCDTSLYSNFRSLNYKKINKEEENKILDIFKYSLYRDMKTSKITIDRKGRARKSEIDIYKNDDDWYILEETLVFPNPFTGSRTEGKSGRYKCDQWDGLLKCIEDKIVLKK